jgi:hypothetical protein
MNLLMWIIIYLIIAFFFLRTISYQCVMAINGYHDYSIKNILIALFFPIGIIYLLIESIIESKESFEDFKKRRLKEYSKLAFVNGKVKKIS